MADMMTTAELAARKRQERTHPAVLADPTCRHLVVRDGRCALCDVKVARYTL